QNIIRNSFIAGFILMPLLVLLVWRNLRIRREAKKLLYKQNEKLIKLDQFKESMTGMIVHDLKNPLNVILNATEKEPLKNLRRVKQTGKQMLNMVLNILDVHKYEETKMIVDKLDYSLFDISLEAINEVVFLAQQKNIEIKNEISKETGIKADREIIERVFVNILTNAIKYTPNNGKISVGSLEPTTLNPQQIKIKITDSGQGIPQDQLSKVFDKFGQITAKKSGTVRSTGLGLTFCKMAVEAHGGEIGVESEIENLPADKAGGTSFWFTLPIGKDSKITKKSGAEQMPVHEEMSSNITILTTEEKIFLKPFILQFKKCEIYEISILRDLLKQIDLSENENINNWKEEMSEAIRSGNEELYRELINGTTKKQKLDA
ncbi:MAG: HAMP domain-containing histidine kinase, partial [Deltaproteobacteria bacterium]|nr:HAMP domain-containing histidine kinase [Deltaproteobacteria bacterium]